MLITSFNKECIIIVDVKMFQQFQSKDLHVRNKRLQRIGKWIGKERKNALRKRINISEEIYFLTIRLIWTLYFFKQKCKSKP